MFLQTFIQIGPPVREEMEVHTNIHNSKKIVDLVEDFRNFRKAPYFLAVDNILQYWLSVMFVAWSHVVTSYIVTCLGMLRKRHLTLR